VARARIIIAVAALAAAMPATVRAEGANTLGDLCGRTVRGALTIEGGGSVLNAGGCAVALAPGARLVVTDAAMTLIDTLSFRLGADATLRLERVLLSAETVEVTGEGAVVVFDGCSLALDEPPWIEAEAWDFRGGRVFRRAEVRQP
jgi:hypothetical protein